VRGGARRTPSGCNLPPGFYLRVPKSKRRKNGGKGKGKSLERLNIARLRTNSAEFAQLVRGSFQDFNSAATTAQGYSVFLNYPTYRTTAGGVIGQCPTVTGLLANEQKVFDEYKVTKLTVKYLSWVTGSIRVNTSVAFTAPSTPILIMGIDLDDSAIWTTYAKALSAQNPAVYNRYSGGGMHTMTMRQRDSVDKQKWLNLGALLPSLTSPPDPNNPSKLATIKIYVDGYQVANTTEATIICEWTVLFKGSYTLA
jgi:hypothetical protein